MVQIYKMKILNVATKNKLIIKNHQVLILMLVQLKKDLLAEENKGIDANLFQCSAMQIYGMRAQFEEGRMYYQT